MYPRKNDSIWAEEDNSLCRKVKVTEKRVNKGKTEYQVIDPIRGVRWITRDNMVKYA